MIENQTENEVKKLRTDNGMEFCSNDFNAYCKSQDIVRHYTIPYMPQQNGVAEHMNRTIISRARCMLSNAALNKRFLAEAASTACYLLNCSPSIPLDKKTPIEVLSRFSKEMGCRMKLPSNSSRSALCSTTHSIQAGGNGHPVSGRRRAVRVGTDS